jgi:hypothetical protein
VNVVRRSRVISTRSDSHADRVPLTPSSNLSQSHGWEPIGGQRPRRFTSRGPISHGARLTSDHAAIVIDIVTAAPAVKTRQNWRATRPSSPFFAGLFLCHSQHLGLTAVCLGEIRQGFRGFNVGYRPRHSLGLFRLPAQKLGFLHHRSHPPNRGGLLRTALGSR